MKINKTQAGFTLIEMLLYLSVVVILMSALVPLAWNVIETGAKSGVQQEVSSTARYLVERINYEIRNSTGINSVSGNTISLAKLAGADNPTIISLSAGNVTIKRGAGAATVINSAKTVVASLVFTNYTAADNRSRHIQYLITVNANYLNGRQEYASTVSLDSSAEVRGI